MERNRDFKRQNKASTVVDATIYSLFTDESAKGIQKLTEHAVPSSENDVIPPADNTCLDCRNNKRCMVQINTLAKTITSTNKIQRNKYMKCSTYVRTGSLRIAQTEHNSIKRAIKYNETSILDNRTKHVTPDMVKLQSEISNQIGKHPCITPIIGPMETNNDTIPIPIPSPIISPYSSMTHPTSSNLSFVPPVFSLPKPILSTQFSPIEAVQLLMTLSDGKIRQMIDLPKNRNNRYQLLQTSMSTIVKILMHKKYIPVKRTAMFRLYKQFVDNQQLQHPYNWFDGSKTGRKPALNEDTVDLLVEQYHTKTTGGNSISKTSLSTNINDLIRKEFENNNNKEYSSEVVPETTMRKYVNKIQSIPELNIMQSVSNKTESRAAAEFSIRSTICYLLVVLTTHFIRAKPTKYHRQHKDLMSNPVYSLIRKLNCATLGINQTLDDSNNVIVEELIPVLPRLITSTDECTIFVSNKVISNKDEWYITSRPQADNLPTIDSSKRDIFCTEMSGDKHHRGVRMTLNNTFSAGGRCAPVFACIYGLTSEEMPGNDIVVMPIKGLVAASEQNGSEEVGFVVFIRGKFKTVDELQDDNNNPTNLPEGEDTIPLQPPKKMSKEARVAKLYRELVYYPFIRDIRLKCGLDPESKVIPENLRAVSWMDGCLGQLHLMGQETVLDTEDILKITANKQSPARTAVEQAADVGAMFKLIRALIKSMPGGEICNSHLYHILVESLEKLEKEYADLTTKKGKDIVILPSFKKAAIIAGLSKLPEAMGVAFRVSVVKKAFQDNGQVSRENDQLPNIDKMIGTYRGIIDKEHDLYNKNDIISTYYKEMYENGRIEESSFDKQNVQHDKDTMGKKVSRDFGIHRESCQRAKILSSKKQRQARKALLHQIRINQYNRNKDCYDAESRKYEHNNLCERRVIKTYDHICAINRKTTTNDPTVKEPTKSFISISQQVNEEHFGKDARKGLRKLKPNIDQLKAFIQLRHPIVKFAKNKPIYKALTRFTRDELMKECVKCKDDPVNKRHYKQQINPEDETKPVA